MRRTGCVLRAHHFLHAIAAPMNGSGLMAFRAPAPIEKILLYPAIRRPRAARPGRRTESIVFAGPDEIGQLRRPRESARAARRCRHNPPAPSPDGGDARAPVVRANSRCGTPRTFRQSARRHRRMRTQRGQNVRQPVRKFMVNSSASRWEWTRVKSGGTTSTRRRGPRRSRAWNSPARKVIR